MKPKAFFSRILPISSLLLVVLFKFQNCAPAPNAGTSSLNGGSAQVGLIDNFNPAKVTFLNSSQVVPTNSTTVDLLGLCVGSQKGEMIRYQIIAMGDIPTVVGSGEVACQFGNFQVSLSDVKFSACTERLQVRAAKITDDTSYAEAVLKPDCGV